MFMFNKTNPSPRSRQSSIEGPGFSPSASFSTMTSNAEASVSQGSDASSIRDMPSPEQRARVRSGIRGSVFNLRSRSNTASSTSSFASQALPGMAVSDSPPHRASRDYRHLTGQSFMELPGSKRSIFRGKNAKRLSGQFSPNFEVNKQEEAETGGKRASVLRKGRRMMSQSEDSLHNLKNRISSPFDFQHVTHTDRHQYAAMEQASQEDLATGFWAVRASQVPRRDLTGIKAEDFHFQNFSSENMATQPRSASALGFTSPVLGPESPREGPSESGGPIRISKSVENFSQLNFSSRHHRHTQSSNPPLRVSSKLPLTRIDDLPEEPSDVSKSQSQLPGRSPLNRFSGFWDNVAPLAPSPMGDKLPTMTEEPSYIAHAVTTPDDSAIHAATPPYSPNLEDVVERPEQFTSPRPAPRPPPRSPKSPFSETFSFNNIQYSPVSRSSSRRSSNTRGPITRPISQMSEIFSSPPAARRNSIRRAPTARRISNTWRVIEESWEDDIDFIYDNALEADCDFDWDNQDRDRTPEQQDHVSSPVAVFSNPQAPFVSSAEDLAIQPRQSLGIYPPLMVPSASSLPELESRSAVSASTDNGVQTPSDVFVPMIGRQGSLGEEGGFTLTPSLLVPADFKEQVAREDMYDDLLADYEGSDRHFPLLDSTHSVSSSTRSSRVRSSKRSSYDSSLMSASGTGSGSGSWNSSIRRSASSAGSLPELVHSRRARRDFNLVVDALSEQVTSCASLNDDDTEDIEDDETTPPGRQPHDQTFFAPEREPENETARASIEGEVRASLELARRGSTSSRTPFHHKYTSSDGAAKLLAAPTQPQPKTRKRAASSSSATRADRKPYLSLFPAPPKSQP